MLAGGDRDPIGNTGLAERLEQHSRNNGVALGVAMALCMVIGIAGFIYLYTHIHILPDVQSRLPDAPTASGSASAVAGAQFTTPAPTRIAGTPGANATTVAAMTVGTATPTRPVAVVVASGTADVAPSPTSARFRANYRIVGGPSINYRRDAGTDTAIVKTLPPGTELQATGQSQEVGGERWLRLRDAAGLEGWVREIDLDKIPG